MNEMTVLVLDGHTRGHGNPAEPGSGWSAGRPCCRNPGLPGYALELRLSQLQQPSQESAVDFQTWLREQDKLRNYTLIVPATETSLLGLRRLDENDPLRRKAVIAGNEALDVALDKEKTWQLAHQLRVPAPGGVLLSTLSEIGPAQQFPVVLKPTHSKVMVDGALRTLAVAVVKNESERQEQLRRWLPFTPVQQQEYVHGRGVGVEFLFNRGKEIWHFAHERVHEYPLTGGRQCTVAQSIPQQRCCTTAKGF